MFTVFLIWSYIRNISLVPFTTTYLLIGNNNKKTAITRDFGTYRRGGSDEHMAQTKTVSVKVKFHFTSNLVAAELPLVLLQPFKCF